MCYCVPVEHLREALEFLSREAEQTDSVLADVDPDAAQENYLGGLHGQCAGFADEVVVAGVAVRACVALVAGVAGVAVAAGVEMVDVPLARRCRIHF